MQATEDRTIWMVGVCHRRASAAVREQVAYGPDALRLLLERLRAAMPDVEALLVSTCNRTEAYLVGRPARELPAEFVALHDEIWPGSAETYRVMLERILRDDEAVEHLVRVACGLESSVVGDSQILGQLRTAVTAASDAGTLGPCLARTSAIALRAGRRARAPEASVYTPLGAPSAATEAIVRHCTARGLTRPAVLLLGAGTMGSALAEELTRRLPAQLTIAARTDARAEMLAGRVGADRVPWDAWRTRVRDAHVVVCATAARQPVLTHSDLDGRSASDDALFVVDLGLPRNVDPMINDNIAVVLTIDDLAAYVTVPTSEITRREAAVENGMTEWREWHAMRAVDAIIGELYGGVDRMVAAAAEECSRSALDPRVVERAVRAQVRALLDGHVRSLRSVARDLARCGPGITVGSR